MSLLEIVTAVADECGYEVDTAVVDSTDNSTKQLHAIANRLVAEMAELYPWPKLWKSYSFTLSNGTATYALPGDFSGYHFDTFWNSSNNFYLRGPISPQEYSEMVGLGIDSLPHQSFAVRGVTNNELLIYPTPGASVSGQTIIFEYLSNRYVRPRTWAAGQAVTAGDYTFYNGVYYTASTTGTTGGSTGPTGDSGVTWATYSGAYQTFQADTDEPVLSSRILQQGILERFAAIKNVTAPDLFYQQAQADYGRVKPGTEFSVVDKRDERVVRAWGGRVTFGRV